MQKKVISLITVLLSILLVLSGCSTKNNDYDSDAVTPTEQENIIDEENNDPVIEEVELTVNYQKISFGKAEVIGFSGEGNTITIDSEYEGCDVVRIADSAFENCGTLINVYSWADIEEYGDNCFRNCSSLKEISISGEAEIIGNHAFDGCVSLKEVYIFGDPEIGEYAFANCTSLKEISIPSDTDNVGNHAFENCTSLAELYIFGSKTIGDYAFANCASLKEVSIPSDIVKVGNYAFYGCTSLEEVLVWDDDITFGTNAFANCPKLKDKPIEDSEPIANFETTEPSTTVEIAKVQTTVSVSQYEKAYIRDMQEYDLYYMFDTDTNSVVYFGTDDTYVEEGTYTGEFSSGVTITWKHGEWTERFTHKAGNSATLVDGNGWDWEYKVCDVAEAQRILSSIE